jgi:hypothetical protein
LAALFSRFACENCRVHLRKGYFQKHYPASSSWCKCLDLDTVRWLSVYLDGVKSTTVNYNILINKQTRPCIHVSFADIPTHRFVPTTATFFIYYFLICLYISNNIYILFRIIYILFLYFLVQRYIANLSLANRSCVVVRSKPGYYTDHARRLSPLPFLDLRLRCV